MRRPTDAPTPPGLGITASNTQIDASVPGLQSSPGAASNLTLIPSISVKLGAIQK